MSLSQLARVWLENPSKHHAGKKCSSPMLCNNLIILARDDMVACVRKWPPSVRVVVTAGSSMQLCHWRRRPFDSQLNSPLKVSTTTLSGGTDCSNNSGSLSPTRQPFSVIRERGSAIVNPMLRETNLVEEMCQCAIVKLFDTDLSRGLTSSVENRLFRVRSTPNVAGFVHGPGP